MYEFFSVNIILFTLATSMCHELTKKPCMGVFHLIPATNEYCSGDGKCNSTKKVDKF